MQLGVEVSDGPNDVSDSSVSSVPFHINLFIISRNVFQIQRTLNLILLEANDNKPIFQESSYDIAIPEVSQTYLS